MSKVSTIEVQCNQCGSAQPFAYWDSINVTLDPERKEQVISKELFTLVCRSCSESPLVTGPFLYHDMGARLMIQMMPTAEGEPPPSELLQDTFGGIMEDYRFRLVRTFNELTEKIFIFDEGYDDRLFECYKVMIYYQASQELDTPLSEIRFGGVIELEGTRTLKFLLLVEGQPEPMYTLIQEPEFEAAVASIQSQFALPELEEPFVWKHITLDYALELLERGAHPQ